MSGCRRAFRSSSQGELSVINQLRPIESPVSFLQVKDHPALVNNVKSREQKPPRRVTWTLGSPEKEDILQSNNEKKVNDGFCEFLQACSLCKKKLKENKDVYMYGYLGAFCSAECRDDQIALDGFHKEASKEASKLALGGMMSKKGWQGFGTKRL